MIKVKFDTSPLKSGHAVRGIGAYTKNLSEAFKRQDDLKLVDHHFDLIHYPYFDLFFHTLPLKKSGKTVITVHDVIPLVFPDQFPVGIKGQINFFLQMLSLKTVAAVITDSFNSRADINRYLGYPTEKTHVVYLAASDNFKKLDKGSWEEEIRKKYHLPKDFILYVGDVNYHKNVLGLISVFQKFQKKAPHFKLILVGKAFIDENLAETKEVLRLIKDLDLEENVMRLGWLPEEDLARIYNLASLYCQLSFYEGFGLPVLEAMSSGCPVMAAKTSSLPEICGQAALLVDPQDEAQILNNLTNFFSESKLKESLIQKGFIQAKKFSWQKCAQETINVYKKII